MIRKILLSTVAIAAISGTAFAADLPSRRAPPVYIPPPIPVFSWTGFYVGGQVGYEFGKDSVNTNFGPLAFYSINPSGVIGGAHLGYNYALGSGFGPGGLVVGLEVDVNGADDRNSTGAAFAPYIQVHRKDVEGSARGRIGIAVDRALFYVTGGAAFAQFHDQYTIGAALGNVVASAQDNRATTRIGYTVGAGMEYAVTPNWSLRAEYRYTDFGTYQNNAVFFPVVAGPFNISNKVTDNRVQVGFSYKFESPIAAPVVARY